MCRVSISIGTDVAMWSPGVRTGFKTRYTRWRDPAFDRGCPSLQASYHQGPGCHTGGETGADYTVVWWGGYSDWHMATVRTIKTFNPKPNCRYFTDDIFKGIFWKKIFFLKDFNTTWHQLIVSTRRGLVTCILLKTELKPFHKKIQRFSFYRTNMKLSAAKCRPFC